MSVARSTTPSRPYRSPLRAEQAAATRTAILDTAYLLFSRRGWQVGVREIATHAGCSVETIYSSYGSKLGLLLAATDVSIVGDEEQVPLAARPEFIALGVGSRRERVERVARLALAIHERTAAIARALDEAARVEAEAAAHVEARNAQIAVSQRQMLVLLLGRQPDEDEVLDAAVIGSLETYHVLTQGRGLTAEEYVAWVRRHLDRLTATRRTRNSS